MSANSAPERWMRGPVPGFASALMPIAHALLQAREDVERVTADVTVEEMSQRPGSAASAGYHLRHLAGSLDRLFTYARGESLSDAQLSALAQEDEPGESAPVLISAVLAQIDRALDQLRRTPVEHLAEARGVGRARLPSTVLGLLFHAAEHTARHVGQLTTTLMVVRGLDSTGRSWTGRGPTLPSG